MSSGNRKPRRSALLSFRFLGTSVIGSLAMALVSVFAPLPAQVAVLGALVSIMAGLFLSYLEQENERERRWAELLEKVRVPVELAPEHELFDHYSAYSEALTELAKQTDPILRASALLKLSSITEQVEALAEGRLVFASTEAWRTLYEQLLRSPDIKKYCSVAWVKTKDYWQDQPGRQSMSVNFEACHRGTLIERIIILRDSLWPRGSSFLPGHPPVDRGAAQPRPVAHARSRIGRRFRAGPARRRRHLRRPRSWRAGARRALAHGPVYPVFRPAEHPSGPGPLAAFGRLRCSVSRSTGSIASWCVRSVRPFRRCLRAVSGYSPVGAHVFRRPGGPPAVRKPCR